jgi:DNA-binding transcriptional MerR regulator
MLRARKSKPVASSGEQGFNSSDVSRICGVSLRQLQWWDERNVVSPRQDGHKRVYMTEEVVEISVIAELRRKGFSLQKIRRVLRFLQKDMGKRLSDALASAADVHLLTDGKSIYLEEAPQPHHRSAEERPPAHVSGVRHRSGQAPDGHRGTQAGAVGNGGGAARKKR